MARQITTIGLGSVAEEPFVTLHEHLGVRPPGLPTQSRLHVFDVEPHRPRVHHPVIWGEGCELGRGGQTHGH